MLFTVTAGNREVVPGRILLKVRPGVGREAFRTELQNYHAVEESEISGAAVKILRVPEQKWARVLEILSKHPMVEFAEPDHLLPPEITPNDTYYNLQWQLPKIAAPAAWDVTRGSSNIVIAIIDTGVEGGHADLVNQLVPGWNFYDGNSDTTDVYGHGTAVAGTAAASSNDGQGVAGVAWNCKIMPLRVTDTSGLAFESTIASALTWAADHGARVANISFRASNSSSVRSAAQYFQNKGGVVTVSAGNDGIFDTAGDNPYVLTISATDSNDQIASWSNTGNNVDLAAPGQDIVTTYEGGWYGYWSGTSFSAPIVAGAAALVLSINPGLSGVEAANVLKQSADDLGVAGYDTTYGWGRLNVSKAVNLAFSKTTNTAPTISSIADQVINEDASPSAIAFTIGDAETAPSNLSVSASSSNPALVPNSAIVFGGTGTSRTVQITPAANQFGTATISITVSDGALSKSISFLLTVNSVNDAPTISTIPSQQVITGQTLGPIPFSISDVETAAASLTLTVGTSNPNLVPLSNIVLGGTGTDRTIRLSSVSGLAGTALITLTVSDGTLLTAISFSLTVLANPTLPAALTDAGGVIIRIDSTTQGNWQGAYGNEGQILAGDFATLPGYATVNLNGNTESVWNANSIAAAALQRVGLPGRVAACWSASTSLDIKFSFLDTNYHRLTFYFLDYDAAGRQQTINIFDSNTGALLQSRNVSGFQQGVYHSYDLKGNVTMKVRGVVGTPVLSGIFFGSLKDARTVAPVLTPATGSTLTAGQAISMTSATYGATIRYTVDGSTPTGNSTLYIGPITLNSSATVKAIATRSGLLDSFVAGASYSVPSPLPPSTLKGAPASMTQINLTWTDDSTNETGFKLFRKNTANGTYSLIAALPADSTSYTDSGLNSGSGYFYALSSYNSFGDSPISETTANTLAQPAGVIIRIDSTTQGNWQGSYGNEGQMIVGDSSAIPPYATVTPLTSTDLVWDANSAASAALQRAGTAGRVAACWTASTSLDIKFSFTDPNYHRVTFYFLDYDASGRQQTINFFDSNSGALLSSRNVSSFQQGIYHTYDLKGNVTMKVRGVVGTPVVSGIFFGSLKDAQVWAPVMTPGSGSVLAGGQAISMTSATYGATIRYTTDGTTPNANSLLYSGPIPLSSNTTIKAAAVRYGLVDSFVTTASYSVL